MVRVSGWGHFGISLGLHGIIEGHFGIRLRIILGYILDHSGIIWFQVVIILGLHGYDFGAMLYVFQDYFGIILALFWDDFGVLLGSCWDEMESVWHHFWDRFGIVFGTIPPD